MKYSAHAYVSDKKPLDCWSLYYATGMRKESAGSNSGYSLQTYCERLYKLYNFANLRIEK